MDQNPQSSSRRTFYQRIIYGVSSLIAASLTVPAIGYLFLPSRRKGNRGKGWTDAGDVSDLPLNQPRELAFQRKRVDGWKTSTVRATAWVVRSESEVIAFSPRCTHLGCGYHWETDKDRFVCPCHTSGFSMTGEVLEGPAPRPLDRFETRTEGNRLWLGRVQSIPENGGQ
jgi:menaquinol-cytochrome c reductase iron-sulfur subunit